MYINYFKINQYYIKKTSSAELKMLTNLSECLARLTERALVWQVFITEEIWCQKKLFSNMS
jgi:isoleucyl-tRNA synthetase